MRSLVPPLPAAVPGLRRSARRAPGAACAAARPRAAVLRSLAVLALALLSPAAAAAQRAGRPLGTVVRGFVHDTAGRPLVNVQVTATEQRFGVYTRGDGSFVLPELSVGEQHMVRARRIGYAPEFVLFDLAPGDTIVIRFVLRPVQELPTVVTEVDAMRARRFAEFDSRRRRGIGTFVTRDDLDRLRARRPSDALLRVAGVGFTYDASGQRYLSMTRSAIGASSPCRPLVYINGMRFPLSDGMDIDDALPTVDEIEGIEIYKGTASVPLELDASRSACGALVFWTR